MSDRFYRNYKAKIMGNSEIVDQKTNGIYFASFVTHKAGYDNISYN